MNETQHWYKPDGTPMHFIELKTRAGTRPTTIRDARVLGLYPSVTSVLKDVLRKPGLERYFVRQAVLAVVTAPDIPGESIDDKITRVLEVERQQDQEAAQARDLGSLVHELIHSHLMGKDWGPGVDELPDGPAYLKAAMSAIEQFGKVVAAEFVVIGPGFAGTVDLLTERDGVKTVIDFKTCKELPKASWPEHRLQLAAYASRIGGVTQTCNVYLSTTCPGGVIRCVNENWQKDYEVFKKVFEVWCWMQNYYPAPKPEQQSNGA